LANGLDNVDQVHLDVSAAGGVVAAWTTIRTQPTRFETSAVVRTRTGRWVGPTLLVRTSQHVRVPIVAMNGDRAAAFWHYEIPFPRAGEIHSATFHVGDGWTVHGRIHAADDLDVLGVGIGSGGRAFLHWYGPNFVPHYEFVTGARVVPVGGFGGHDLGEVAMSPAGQVAVAFSDDLAAPKSVWVRTTA
jgi:hypothetical protein